jgi:phosphoribosylpyrophosphate synthetase
VVSPAFTIFAGSANPALAAAIARTLGVRIGACAVDRFPDGEMAVELLEPVRRRDVFLLPVNDHLVELLTLADACRRAAAARITVVMQYFAYARAAASRSPGGWSPTCCRRSVSPTSRVPSAASAALGSSAKGGPCIGQGQQQDEA